MTKLPPPTGTMTVTYELDRRVKVPMWDEAALRGYAAAAVQEERERCLALLDEHARAVDVWHVRELIKGDA